MRPLASELAAHLIGDIQLGVHVEEPGIALVQDHIQLLLLGHGLDRAFQFLEQGRQLSSWNCCSCFSASAPCF